MNQVRERTQPFGSSFVHRLYGYKAIGPILCFSIFKPLRLYIFFHNFKHLEQFYQHMSITNTNNKPQKKKKYQIHLLPIPIIPRVTTKPKETKIS